MTCKDGHDVGVDKRGRCLECIKICTRRWQAKNRAHSRAKVRLWRIENPDKFQALKARTNLVRRNLSEEERVKVRGKNRKWQKENHEQVRMINRIRMAFKRAACPKWADKEAIKQIYKNCPDGMHVDHIIPFKGKTVTGLHVANNLQYLTKDENLSKSNKYNELAYPILAPVQ